MHAHIHKHTWIFHYIQPQSQKHTNVQCKTIFLPSNIYYTNQSFPVVLGIHIWFLINKRFHRWCNTKYDNVCIHYKSDREISSGRMLNAYCIEFNVNHIRSKIWFENSLMGYQGINWMMKYRLPNTFSGVEFQTKYCLLANTFISDLPLINSFAISVRVWTVKLLPEGYLWKQPKW